MPSVGLLEKAESLEEYGGRNRASVISPRTDTAYDSKTSFAARPSGCTRNCSRHSSTRPASTLA